MSADGKRKWATPPVVIDLEVTDEAAWAVTRELTQQLIPLLRDAMMKTWRETGTLPHLQNDPLGPPGHDMSYSEDKLGWFDYCIETIYLPNAIDKCRPQASSLKRLHEVDFAALYNETVQTQQCKEELYQFAKMTPGEFWPVTPRSAYRLMAAAEYMQGQITNGDFAEEYGYALRGEARAAWATQGSVSGLLAARLDPLRERDWFFGLRDCFTRLAQRIAAGNKPHPRTHAELWACCLLFDADAFLMEDMVVNEESAARFDALPEHPCDVDMEITRFALLGPVYGSVKKLTRSAEDDEYMYAFTGGYPSCIHNLPDKPISAWFDPLPKDYFKVTPSSAAAAAQPKWDSQLSSAGWRNWPVVEEGDYSLVYVVPDQKFGYYDDDEDEDECIVYFGEPLMGPCKVFPRSELRKPPFNGELVAM